jgi:uncharacterized membrane protein
MYWQQIVQNIAETSAFGSTEQTIVAAAQWLKLGVEAVGALIIGYGVLSAIYQFGAHFRDKEPSNFNRVRLTLGKYLTLALEFQVGADILSTAIAPGWEQIGKLAAIVVIRTVLNYFLTREVETEQLRQENGKVGADNSETKI